jgi:hypothetical protein
LPPGRCSAGLSGQAALMSFPGLTRSVRGSALRRVDIQAQDRFHRSLVHAWPRSVRACCYALEQPSLRARLPLITRQECTGKSG